MRNPSLQAELEALASEAGAALRQAASDGEGVPFEVTESDTHGPGGSPLYCYRPLTGHFVRSRQDQLAELPAYELVRQTLDGVGGLEHYLRARGTRTPPGQESASARLVINEFLARIYGTSTDFTVDPARFDTAYTELERTIYEGRCVTEVIAPLWGIDLDADTRELMLGEGLAIVRSGVLVGAPAELGHDPRQLLLVLRVAHERGQHPSIAFARQRFERVLTALRLYDRGTYAIGQIGFKRIDGGVWTPVAAGSGGRRDRLTLIPPRDEPELRSFCGVIGRRLTHGFGGDAGGNSGAGEVAWALRRFEMGCERSAALEALTDYLIGLRALLEPEGPASGRLMQRLAVICAAPDGRLELAERTAAAVALERSVMAGLATSTPESEALVGELAEHLRAVLRDVLCGHLDADLCAVADELLAESIESDSLVA